MLSQARKRTTVNTSSKSNDYSEATLDEPDFEASENKTTERVHDGCTTVESKNHWKIEKKRWKKSMMERSSDYKNSKIDRVEPSGQNAFEKSFYYTDPYVITSNSSFPEILKFFFVTDRLTPEMRVMNLTNCTKSRVTLQGMALKCLPCRVRCTLCLLACRSV